MPVHHRFGAVLHQGSSKTYKHGKYAITVNADGSIRVKHNDWLTKYSAAIYGDFFHVADFQRKNPAGELVPIRNPNRIFAGEVIYHVPTATKAANWMPVNATVVHTTLSDHEKRSLILSHVKDQYHLKGDDLEVAEKLVFGAHTATEATEILELFEAVGEGIGEFASIAGIVLFPIHAAIDIFNSQETGYRHIAMRAVAYGITSWAWNDPPPPPPTWIHNQIPTSALNQPGGSREFQRWVDQAAANDKYQTDHSKQSWNDGCKAGREGQEKIVIKKRLKKEDYQTLLQGLGDWDRTGLVVVLLEHLSEELDSVQKRSFNALPRPKYPTV